MTEKAEESRARLGRLRVKRRRIVDLSQEKLVLTGRLETGASTPLVIRPALDGVDLIAWVTRNRSFLDTELVRYGAILFRGFQVRDAEEFERIVRAAAGEPMEYRYRSTPRTRVAGGVYTSTEYPADQAIPLHNEMSYAREWPLKIFFFSVQVADEGGATPLANSREVYERIPAEIREELAHRGVMYVRNYTPGVDLPWQEVFQSADRAEVEAFCRQAGIECEWVGPDHLLTRQVCPAVARHPRTGETVWFNQAHLFHVSSLPDHAREVLLQEFGEAALPRNAVFGDGGALPAEALDTIREAYRAETLRFPWEPNDVLMVDNMLMAHGREPYRGRRKVVAAMAEPWSAGAVAPGGRPA